MRAHSARVFGWSNRSRDIGVAFFVSFSFVRSKEIRRARFGGVHGGDEVRVPGMEITNLERRARHRPAKEDAGLRAAGLAPEVKFLFPWLVGCSASARVGPENA